MPDTEIEAMYSNKWRERERGGERHMGRMYSLHRLDTFDDLSDS